MALNDNFDTIDHVADAQPATNVAVQPVQTTAVAAPQVTAPFSAKAWIAERESREPLDASATFACTVIQGNIKFGDNMQHVMGDHFTMLWLNIRYYRKLDLCAGQNLPEAAKDLIANSYDGKVTKDDVDYTEAEYLEIVKEAGYAKAEFKDRAAMQGVFMDAEGSNKWSQDLRDTMVRKRLTVYLSPSSLRKFKTFTSTLVGDEEIAQDLGELPRNVIGVKLINNTNSYKGNSWNDFTFQPVYQKAPV